MSIINQMLRDLDARHASTNERVGLPAGLRTLPPERSRPVWPWFLLVGGMAAGVAIAWVLLGQMPAPMPVPTPAPVAATPQPAPPPPPAPATEPPVSTTVPPASAPAVVAPKPAVTLAPATKPVPVPEPVAKAPPDKPVQTQVAAPPASVVAAVPVAPTGEARIDKQPKGIPAHELAEAEYRKGMQAAGIGDHAGALPALRRALEIEPRHAKARQALLSVLASSRQWDEVKQVAQSGLALDPSRTGWASILARLQHEQGDTEGAVKTLETHAAQAAGDADYQGLFAFLLQKRQRHADAAQHYQAALALRPAEGRWWYGLGLALEGAGRGDEAKSAFGKAREAGNLSADMLGVIEQKLR